MNSNYHYSAEKSHLQLLSLLKQYGVSKIIVSPGATNVALVVSLMNDSYFQLFSSVDERSAAYMACGMAETTGDIIAICCTGATASRNYIPGITEAYYRKLPILAITATQPVMKIGHLVPQVIDRSIQIKDTYICCETIRIPHTEDEEWDINLRLNRALLSLTKDGGGPVNINLETEFSRDFSIKKIPFAKKINRYKLDTDIASFPEIPDGKIGIRVGRHRPMSKRLVEEIDKFCDRYQAVVFCEFGSNYNGRYRVYNSLLSYQKHGQNSFGCRMVIHLGETSAYGNNALYGDETWRLNEDGELRDLTKNLSNVFQMPEVEFFRIYNEKYNSSNIQHVSGKDWYDECQNVYRKLMSSFPEIPFSNIWIAKHTIPKIPEKSLLSVAILNSHRAWTIFEVADSLKNSCFVNTGGFGIDGCMSSTIGASIVHPDKIHFLITGDLAFFYDLNSLGNRHIGKNLRILVINNGKGTEFRNYGHYAAQFGDSTDEYIAAAGHFGNKSTTLIRDYSQNLGFKYLHASTKEEYLNQLHEFTNPQIGDNSIVFEVFTNSQEESEALYRISNIIDSEKLTWTQKVGTCIPQPVKGLIKRLLK